MITKGEVFPWVVLSIMVFGLGIWLWIIHFTSTEVNKRNASLAGAIVLTLLGLVFSGTGLYKYKLNNQQEINL